MIQRDICNVKYYIILLYYIIITSRSTRPTAGNNLNRYEKLLRKSVMKKRDEKACLCNTNNLQIPIFMLAGYIFPRKNKISLKKIK